MKILRQTHLGLIHLAEAIIALRIIKTKIIMDKLLIYYYWIAIGFPWTPNWNGY